MKNKTNNTTKTIRAAMILLLAAGAASPRGMQGGSRGGSMGSHSMPTHSAAQGHSTPHSQPAGMPHSTPHSTPHSQPGGMPHSTPHSAPQGHYTPHSTPHNPVGHSTPGGYQHSGGSYHGPARGGYVSHGGYAHGGGYAHSYRPYHYRGIEFHAYRPGRFFAPRFYGWVDSPWAYRVHYRWGWYGSPWFVGYRGYFTPYGVYSSAPFWLTDYLVATSLQEAWQQGVGGCNCYGMSPAVKQSIAMEVHRQIALEKAEASGYQASAPAFLDGNSHAFVVRTATTANAGNQACALTGGDVVQLDGASSVNGGNATVQVVSSKGQDCTTGSYVGVTLAQLQDMQNGMRETIDEGLATLQAEQGQNGLPTLAAGM